MSCHFHLMRRRKAAEAAQKAAEAAQNGGKVEIGTNTEVKPEPAQKAPKGRRKGDAK